MKTIEITINNAEALGFDKLLEVANWRNQYRKAFEKDQSWRKEKLFEKYMFYQVTLDQMVESLPHKYTINVDDLDYLEDDIND